MKAIARPNKHYIYYNNLRSIVIEARKEGSDMKFYEVREGKDVKCLTVDTVKNLFPSRVLTIRQPFLKKENRQFYKLLTN